MSAQALRTADQVRRILGRALRLLESGKLFESEVGGGSGDGSSGQLTLDEVRRQPEAGPPEPGVAEPEPADAETPATPATPAEPAQPRRGGGSGVGEVVIRAVDPRLRSAMVVEDGIRRVVINSRYPLFEVRKGDLWYQLETALREVCLTIPEATVPEFERKVNELMLVSLSLAGRRPRRPRATAAVGQRPGSWSGR